MSEELTANAQAEKTYIDSLLNFSPVITSDEKPFFDEENAVTDINITVNEALYQIICVSGMKFAIPLSEISTAIDYVDVTINGQVLLFKGNKLNIINLNDLISNNGIYSGKVFEHAKYLLLNARGLAIACEQINTIENIMDNSVCWRNKNSNRLWLSGTNRQMGVAILDLETLENMNSRKR